MGIEAKHSYRFGYLKSEQWSSVRLEALAREGGKCQICFHESIHNDAHHIWYPEHIYETREHHLVVLCRPCHNFLHTMMPECKTNNEEDGKANWLKISNAVKTWRYEHIGLFATDIGLKLPAQDLRKELKRVWKLLEEKDGIPKEQVVKKLNQIKSLTESFIEGLK